MPLLHVPRNFYFRVQKKWDKHLPVRVAPTGDQPSACNGYYVMSENMRIDLNADVGEAVGDDQALLCSVTSANIACGLHAGDPTVMRRTVRLAIEAGVSIGAHPGFPDLQGFGRRELNVPPREVEDLVLYQVAALAGIAAAEGARLRHVKPHGALYNMAVRNGELAAAVVAGVSAFDRSLVIVAPPASQLMAAAARDGMRAAAEAFADRAYHSDGSLVPRDGAGAVIDDPSIVLQRALRLVRAREVVASDGSVISLAPDTICVHGDTRQAAKISAELRRGLAEAGVLVAPLGGSGQ
jgi:UPF0271 protein